MLKITKKYQLMSTIFPPYELRTQTRIGKRFSTAPRSYNIFIYYFFPPSREEEEEEKKIFLTQKPVACEQPPVPY